jgi:valyl-tRNA synthetase
MDEGCRRRAQGVRRALHRRADLPRQAAGELGPEACRPRSPTSRSSRRRSERRLWHFAYPLEGRRSTRRSERDFIVVATRGPRPCWATPRGRASGRRALQGTSSARRDPAAGRPQDPDRRRRLCRPEKGSGAVKITPAHDFNDFEVGKRHGLAAINILDAFAKILTTTCPSAYRGRARPLRGAQAIVADAGSAGLLEKIEPHTPHGAARRPLGVVDRAVADRPVVRRRRRWPSRRSKAVREGKHALRAEDWEKTYFDWMRNIQPWCISRQLWWGHQIPAWYGPDGKVFVERRRRRRSRRPAGRRSITARRRR